MSRLALYLLGPPRVELDDQPVHLGRRKALALLAYLAVERGSRRAEALPPAHSRDGLATLLWSEYDQRGARGRLRRTLSSLSRAIGGERFATDRETVGLNPEAELWLDVAQFRQRLAACEV